MPVTETKLRHTRWSLILPLIALSALAAAWLARGPSRRDASEPAVDRRPVMDEIGEANMSPDGTFLALEGSQVFDDATDDRGSGVQFLDVASREVVAWTGPRWWEFLPNWAGEHAWLMECYSPSGRPELIWAPSPMEESSRVSPPAEGYRLTEGFLTPDIQWAIVDAYFPDAEDEASLILAIPLQGGDARTLWARRSDMQLVAVVGDPADPAGTLVLVAGTEEGPARRPGLCAISFPANRIPWRARLGDKLGLMRGYALFGPDMVLIAEEPLAASAAHDGFDPSSWWIHPDELPKSTCTRLWLIDLANGDSRLLAEIPLPHRMLSVLPGDGSRPLVFFGGIVFGGVGEVWSIEGPPGSAKSTKIIQGPKGSRLAGARRNTANEVELYLTTRHCVWLCRLKDRSVERIWGTRREDDDPPTILASP